MIPHRFTCALLIWLCLPACFMSRDTLNEPLVAQKIAALVPGQSSATDVAATLGAPNEVVQLGHGSAWRYDFTVRKTAGFSIIVLTLVNTDARADRAWLFFDKDGKLTHSGSSLEAKNTEYAMPWEDVYGG